MAYKLFIVSSEKGVRNLYSIMPGTNRLAREGEVFLGRASPNRYIFALRGDIFLSSSVERVT